MASLILMSSAQKLPADMLELAGRRDFWGSVCEGRGARLLVFSFLVGAFPPRVFRELFGRSMISLG
jgi:hypothetical protein